MRQFKRSKVSFSIFSGLLVVLLLTFTVAAIAAPMNGTSSSAAAAKTARLNAIVQRMLSNQPVSAQEKQEAYPLFLRAEHERDSHQPPTVANNGGPDAGGYYWIDNVTEPNGPTYSWVDISSTGTQVSVTSTDDGSCVLTNIGFSFPFYGTNYTQFTIGTNGWISFSGTYAGLGSGYYSNTALPASTQPHPALFVFWDDWYSTNMRYQVVNSQLVIEWVASTSFSGGSGTFTVEAILDPSGTIKYQYNTLGTSVSSATIGIQNAAGTTATQVNFNGSPAGTTPANGRAIFFYQLGQAGTPAPANNATNQPTNATLNWSAANAATGYDVYFNTFTPPTTLVSSNQVGLSYNPGALSATTQYYWQIVSRNAGGTNAGPVWNFTTGAGAAPNAPSGGFTSGATSSSLTVNWVDNSNNETGFPITSSTDGITYNPLTTAAANATTYNNTGLNSNTQYWYNVYSQNGGGTSVGFATANGWTLALTPGTPTLSSTGITAGTIALVNGGNNAGTQFAIYETGTGMYVQANGTLGASAVWQTAATWGATTTITGLLANTTYHVQAKARNGAAVETGMSGTLNFTTNGSYSLPFSQDFSGATFPPADWSIINPDGLDTWAHYVGSPSWATIDFWSYTNYPQDDYLVTPPINTVGVAAAEVDFNWSYYGAYTSSYNDGLEVKYSTDGGTTWTSFWSRYAQSTPSLPAGTGSGTTNPATSNYGLGAVSVPAGALGQSSVEFAWMGHNAYGPNLYVTNISIFSVTGPVIAATPVTLNFTNVIAGLPASNTTYIHNTGATNLHITNITATTASPNITSATVAPGDSVAVILTWTPASVTTLADNAVITSDATNNASLQIPLNGNSVNPLVAAPTTATFGTIAVGANSMVPIGITNNSTVSVDVTSLNLATDITANWVSFPHTIAPGATDQLQLTWTPSAPGALAGNELVNDAFGAVSIANSGTALEASLNNTSFSPPADVAGATFNFGVDFVSQTAGVVVDNIVVYVGAASYPLSYVSGTLPGTVHYSGSTALSTVGQTQIYYLATFHDGVNSGLTAQTPYPSGTMAGPDVLPAQVGGPDGFGYRFKTSAAPGGPVYNWVDISGTGALLNSFSSLDDGVATLSLGTFVFPFYGTNYSSVTIGTNGNIQFPSGSTQTTYINSTLPTATFAGPAICPLWDDFVLYSGVKYQDMGDGRFVLDWLGYHYSVNTDTMHIECILYANGNILVQCQTIHTPGTTSGTVGIQGATSGTNFLEYGDATVVPVPGSAILFYLGNPDIALSGNTVNYGYNLVGNPDLINVWVYSTGALPLGVSSVTSATATVVPSWSSNSINPGDSLLLGLTWTPTTSGALASYAVIASNALTSPSDTIWLNGNGYTPPGVPAITVTYDKVNSNANVAWSLPTGTVDGYKVYRETTSGLFNPTGPRLVATINGSANTSYLDANVTGHEYYRVTAFNAASSSSSSLSYRPGSSARNAHSGAALAQLSVKGMPTNTSVSAQLNPNLAWRSTGRTELNAVSKKTIVVSGRTNQ